MPSICLTAVVYRLPSSHGDIVASPSVMLLSISTHVTEHVQEPQKETGEGKDEVRFQLSSRSNMLTHNFTSSTCATRKSASVIDQQFQEQHQDQILRQQQYPVDQISDDATTHHHLSHTHSYRHDMNLNVLMPASVLQARNL